MSAFANFQNIISLIGICLTLAGIVVVVLQLRQIQTSIQSTSHSAVYEHGAEFRANLIQYPHLRKHFFEGVPASPNDNEIDRLATIAESYLNYLEHLFLVQEGLGSKNRASVDDFLRFALRESPLAQEMMARRTCAYSERFRTHVGKLLAEEGPCL